MASFVFQMTTQNGDGRQSSAELRDAPNWVVCGPCRARITNDGDGPRASIVNSPAGLATGLVRLDNRVEISRLAGCPSDESDLAIVVAALARYGPKCIRQFEGDFAFAYWDPNRRALIAARDPIGVRLLYRSTDVLRWSFASHAELIGSGRPWSLEFIADCIANNISRTYSPYDGVLRFPSGTYQVVQDQRSREECYWSPHQFSTVWTVDGPSAIEELAALFQQAMRLHLTEPGGCWSHLSGGMDSSSVVSMAGWLAKTDPTIPPLRGTITFVDTVGMGDEREYSDAVVRDWPVRNELIIDYRGWNEEEGPPFATDEPDVTYPQYARDQLITRLVRSTGSRILLTGTGPDHFLHGNYSYFVDWIAQGRIRDAASELYREALRNRISFWKLAYANGIRPLLKPPSRTPPAPNQPQPWPDWVGPALARRVPREQTPGFGPQATGKPGRSFITQAANMVGLLELGVLRGVIGETLDARYPFLHRPLVEFCMRLPPQMKVSGGIHKWILREALRGILPDEIRRRTSKGFLSVGLDRVFVERHARLDALLERSVLGEMGCIDVGLARQALAQRAQRSFSDNACLEHLLMLETWFTVKSGRWTTSENRRSGTQ